MANKFRLDLVDPFGTGIVKTPQVRDPLNLNARNFKMPVDILNKVVNQGARKKTAQMLTAPTAEKKKRSVRDIVADALFAASRGITAQTGITPTAGTAAGIGILKGVRGLSDLFERKRLEKAAREEKQIKELEKAGKLEEAKELARFKAGLKPTAQQKAEEARLIAEARLPAKQKALQFATEEINKRNKQRLSVGRSAGLTEKQAADTLIKAEQLARESLEFVSTFQIQDPVSRAQAQQDIIDRKYSDLISRARTTAAGGIPSAGGVAPRASTVKQPVESGFDINVSGL